MSVGQPLATKLATSRIRMILPAWTLMLDRDAQIDRSGSAASGRSWARVTGHCLARFGVARCCATSNLPKIGTFVTDESRTYLN